MPSTGGMFLMLAIERLMPSSCKRLSSPLRSFWRSFFITMSSALSSPIG